MLESDVKYVVTSLVVIGLSAVLMAQLYWGLATFAVLAGSHVVYKQLLCHVVEEQFERQTSDAQKALLAKDNIETVEWMNSILASVWSLINAEIFTLLVDLLEDALQMQMPSIVYAVRGKIWIREWYH